LFDHDSKLPGLDHCDEVSDHRVDAGVFVKECPAEEDPARET
jgi:hypothetical protein